MKKLRFQNTFDLASIEAFSLQDSSLHKRHSMVLFIIGMTFILVVGLKDQTDLVGLLFLATVPLFMMGASGITLGLILPRMVPALMFIGLFALPNIWLSHDRVVVFGMATSHGLLMALGMCLKGLLSTMMALILLGLIGIKGLSYALVRLKFPRFFVLQLNLTYRYITRMHLRGQAMQEAYALRAPSKKGIALKHLGGIVGDLFVKAYDDGKMIYQAMKLRGYEVDKSIWVSGNKSIDLKDLTLLGGYLLFLFMEKVL